MSATGERHHLPIPVRPMIVLRDAPRPQGGPGEILRSTLWNNMSVEEGHSGLDRVLEKLATSDKITIVIEAAA